jgi:P-type Mg2+ transporter
MRQQHASRQGDERVEKRRPTALMSILARLWHRSPAAPEGLAASGDTLGEIARLPPDQALHRLLATAEGLNARQVKARLRSVGPNQVAHQARHTIIGELVSRSINPLNPAASYLSGDQRVAIVIAVMVALSISLGFVQEHRSNRAADALRRMVRITATVHRSYLAQRKSMTKSLLSSSCPATSCCCRPAT